MKIRFTDIGHLLGSASIGCSVDRGRQYEEDRIFRRYRQQASAAVSDPTPTKAADYVVMESTYGRQDASQGQT